MPSLSVELKTLIQAIIATEEFWKANYYIRSMKKAPHGGVFHIDYEKYHDDPEP